MRFMLLRDKLKIAQHHIDHTIKPKAKETVDYLHKNFKPKAKQTLRFAKKNPKKVFIIFTAAFFVFCGLIALWISTFQMPDLSSFDTRVVSQSTKIYDRTGKVLLYDIHVNAKRTVVSFDEISPNIKNATVAIEDADFYQHGGIKVSSIIRSFFANIFSGSLSQGGSTITQQVIKNSLLTSEKSFSRKIKEWVLSVELEKVMTK